MTVKECLYLKTKQCLEVLSNGETTEVGYEEYIYQIKQIINHLVDLIEELHYQI